MSDQRPTTGERETSSSWWQRSPSWLIWILLLISFAVTFYVFRNANQTETPEISYSQFTEQVEADQVRTVTINGQNISGEFVAPMVLENDRLAPLTDSSDAVDSVTTFKTTMPAGIEAELVELLDGHGVEISADDPNSRISWGTILLYGLPLVLIIGLVLMLNRGMRLASRGQDMFGFSRSRARVYDEKQPQVTFEDVAGEDEAKSELSQCVDFLKTPDRYHELGARLPRGILLVGPPGTGKTLLARAVAGEAGVPFFSVSASEFVEMFVGVGAGRVRDLFEKAKVKAPAIIFVDELDAVGRQRFAGLGGSNDEREQTLNQLLVEMDGFDAHDDVIVISATNRPDVLDPALLRPGRFDWHIELSLPDRRGREAILKIHARLLPIEDDVDLSAFAAITPGFSGADLANLVNQAALTAARYRKKTVGQSDFEEALDKLILGAERPLLMTDHEKSMLAYHEAGHAIVAHFTEGADPLHKISIVPRGHSMGVTVQTPAEDHYSYTRVYLFGRIKVMMGGRAAEQLIFDELTTGAQNDLKEATLLARQMVGLWGMSEEIGPYFLGTGEQHVFLGREITQQNEHSEMMLNRVESAASNMLADALAQAHSILTEHRQELDGLAKVLNEVETLDREAVCEILDSVRPETDLVLIPTNSHPS